MSVYTFSGNPGIELYPDLGVVIYEGTRFVDPVWHPRWWNESMSDEEKKFEDFDWSLNGIVFRLTPPVLLVERDGDRFILVRAES